MDQLEIREKIVNLEKEIAALPDGTVSPKTVKGHVYYYHRFTQNGKRREIYLQLDEVDALRSRIEQRKRLEDILKELQHSLIVKEKKAKIRKQPAHKFRCLVRTGEELLEWALPASNYRHRHCFDQLQEYVFGDTFDRVFILYGLRRTGKTTMIRQSILGMDDEQLLKAAFIQVRSTDTLASINADIRYLEQTGYQYIFIDEVTLAEDFIEGAALFSDIYAASGMKIVLSGTDSLGFLFAGSDQLYDRCFILHTTYISYEEFENVLGIKGIDAFIRYGGTMSMGGVYYNERSSFATRKKADEYVDTAIAGNIQHSLKYYQDGTHFRKLIELYERGELTSAINRVVEDINHRFTRQVLTQTYRSATLSSAARNLLRDRNDPFDLMDNINEEFVLLSIRKILDILEKEEQTVDVSDIHAQEIREYLLHLDLIKEIGQCYWPDIHNSGKKVVIAQTGLRYAQAETLIRSLLLDEKFNELSAVERHRVSERIMGTVKGRMMEDIVLLETSLANPGKEVFQLQFAVGEFDMVIHDPQTLTCEIYEIKYSKEMVSQQYHHLVDEEKCKACEHRYGTITGRYVIYRGESKEMGNIRYLNVEEYLKSLTMKVSL